MSKHREITVRSLVALCLAAVMAVSCATTILLAASKNWSSLKDLGALSQYYETGADADPRAVSTVPGDPGGTSFGLYMFSSKAGTLDAFRTWLRNYQGNAIYNGFAATLDKAYGENASGATLPGIGEFFVFFQYIVIYNKIILLFRLPFPVSRRISSRVASGTRQMRRTHRRAKGNSS